jgi:hypothetical protein
MRYFVRVQVALLQINTANFLPLPLPLLHTYVNHLHRLACNHYADERQQ